MLAVAGSEDGATVIVDRSGTTVAHTWEADGFFPVSAEFSPDGALLATGRRQRIGGAQLGESGVAVRDWRTNEIVTAVNTFGEGLDFSPDGGRLATADTDNTASIWDARTGRLLATLTGHRGGVWDVAFSADGRTLATAGQDGTVRLWDAETGVERLTLPGIGSVVHAVQFSPDGKKLASAGADGVVRVWALDVDDLMRIARDHVTRGMTSAECRQYFHVDTCP